MSITDENGITWFMSQGKIHNLAQSREGDCPQCKKGDLYRWSGYPLVEKCIKCGFEIERKR